MVSLSSISQAWHQFFFAPEPVATLAVGRVLLGLLLMADACLYWPFRRIIFGPDGVLTASAFQRIYGKTRFTLFNLLPETQRTVDVMLVLYFLSRLCVSLGLWTRFSLIGAWVVAVSLQLRGVCFLNGGDGLLRVLLFLFCFSQAGQGLSVDAWLAGNGIVESLRTPVVPWCTRLLQIQIAIVYFRTFAWKMQGETWRNGTAVGYAVANRTYQAWPVPKIFMRRFPIAIATYGTLIIELGLSTLIWIKEFRHVMVILGLLLHLGIEYAMILQMFSWMMVICLLLFVEPNVVIQFAEWMVVG